MPNPPLCRVLLPTGERCGYVPSGDTRKDQLIDLFKHERDVHLAANGMTLPSTEQAAYEAGRKLASDVDAWYEDHLAEKDSK